MTLFFFLFSSPTPSFSLEKDGVCCFGLVFFACCWFGGGGAQGGCWVFLFVCFSSDLNPVLYLLPGLVDASLWHAT